MNFTYASNEQGEWVTIFFDDNKRFIITKNDKEIIFRITHDVISSPRDQRHIELTINRDNEIFIPLLNLIKEYSFIQDDITGNYLRFYFCKNYRILISSLGNGNKYTQPFASVLVKKDKEEAYLEFFDTIKNIALKNSDIRTNVRTKNIDNLE